VKAEGGGSKRLLLFLCLGESESSCDEWSSELEGVRKKGRAMSGQSPDELSLRRFLSVHT
jgi:hypothetical protein